MKTKKNNKVYTIQTSDPRFKDDDFMYDFLSYIEVY